MRLYKATVIALAMLSMAPVPAMAQSEDCDFDYVVKDGDTLHDIAETAYGEANYQLGYQLLLSRNLDKVSEPANLDPGETVVVPCMRESGFVPNAAALSEAMGGASGEKAPAQGAEAPAEEKAAPAAAQEGDAVAQTATEEAAPAAAPEPQAVAEATEQKTASAPEPQPAAAPEPPAPEPPAKAAAASPAPAAAADLGSIRLLTANGLPPFSDKSLRGGGMANELVRAALAKIGLLDQARIVVIDDRDSHLRDLLLEGSFDIGFPWFRPPCEEREALANISEDDVWFCDNFRFSEPLYEFVYGFFVRKGEYAPGRARFSDFVGGRICRPAGPSVKDLLVKGLGEGGTEIVRPENLAQCFDALLSGDVDAVSGEVFEAESIMADRDLADDVEELPDLSLLQTVNAVAPLNKPKALKALDLLNKGLIDLKISGQWFRIVGRHIASN